MTLLTLEVTPSSHLAQPCQGPSSQSSPHLTAHSLSRPGAATSPHSLASVSTRGQAGNKTQVTLRVCRPNPH